MSRRLAPLAALATLALAGSAHAAYAPKIAVSLDPSTPSAPAAITSTITQAIGETASKKVVVAFPVGFSANLDARPVICTDAQEATRSCPPETQIGTAAATASIGIIPLDLPGTVHYGGANDKGIKLIVFLRNQLAGDQTIEGYVKFRDDGGFDTVFDGLPDVLTTTFTLKLQGDDKALSLTPSACGDYVFKGQFTSQKGEQAGSDAKVTIAGCKGKALKTANLTVSKTGSVTFNLTAPASGTVTVKRGATRIASKAFTGRVGVNRVKLGRKLKPGKYRVSLTASSTDGQTVAAGRTVTIRKD